MRPGGKAHQHGEYEKATLHLIAGIADLEENSISAGHDDKAGTLDVAASTNTNSLPSTVPLVYYPFLMKSSKDACIMRFVFQLEVTRVSSAKTCMGRRCHSRRQQC